MKIRPVGAELFLADGRTDMTKLKVAFRNFANAPQNSNLNPKFARIAASVVSGTPSSRVQTRP